MACMPVLLLMCSGSMALQLPYRQGLGRKQRLGQVRTLARSSLMPLCMRVMALWSSGASLAAFLYNSARRPGMSSVSALDEMCGVHRVVSKGQLTG